MQNIKQQFDVGELERRVNSNLYQNQIDNEQSFGAFYNLSAQSEQLSGFSYLNEVEIQQNDKIDLKQKKRQEPKNRKKKKMRYKISNKRKTKKIKGFQIDEDIRLLESVGQIISKKDCQYNLRYRWEELLGIVYYEENEEHFIENGSVNQSIDQIDHSSLIKMLPESYSCPKIRDMLECLITRVNVILNV
ncbi:unnamed protein product (macronuclear) [Paramecium tetraurelia]|uniref:Uncharacterized protein n=1 Tax=Paramecium tetraurelia TaxID=5888 RepID=A0EAT9_PARTE|nr:uncharacterized protein GSPATT00025140001 [Paramecium tetraurelia]CAK92406.1 unnamed protein product [Paramecium tetraurelia]|eukprot:XP_001459803.1 hypothetical protein (macronuclear) [Paramecium tetraurelia strain d4-2]